MRLFNTFITKFIKTKKVWSSIFSDYFVAIALIALGVILSIVSPVFLSISNILNILVQTSINSIVAVGMTMVILTGGIDLSVGSIVALAGVTAGLTSMAIDADVTSAGLGIVCIIMALAVGALAGLVNGVLISKAKLPAFIATLGMMSIARGLALTISGGLSITKIPAIIKFIGSGHIGFINFPIIFMIVIYFIAWWVLRYTRLGRNTYAVGGNMEAARLSGVKVQKTLIIVYMISGICSSIAALLLTGRLNSAQPVAGSGYELDAIAATVIGGTNMSGGEGQIIGTLIGALLVAVLRNGLNLLNVSPYSTQIVIGTVIILAVMMDTLRNREKK
jgi:ribose/xylose/arabinose/galactoside ABC-type transport system permease subunit